MFFAVDWSLDDVGRVCSWFNRLLVALFLVYFIEVILHIATIAQYNESPFSLATSCIMFMMLFVGWYGVHKKHTAYLNLYFVGGAILVVILVISSIIFLVLITQMSATLSRFNKGLSDVSFTSDGVFITNKRIALDTAAAVFSLILSVLQIISCGLAGHIRNLIIRTYYAGFPPSAAPVFSEGSYTPPVIESPQTFQSYQQPQGAPQYAQYSTSPQQVYLYPNYPTNNNNNNNNNNTQASSNQGKPNSNPYSYKPFNESNETTPSP